MIQLSQYRTHAAVDEIKQTEQAQIRKHKLTGNVRNVYSLIVGSSFGNLGACKLKADTIATKLGISRSTVTRCIKKLKDLHVIEVHNTSKGNGIKGANVYSVIFLTQSEPLIEPVKSTQRATHRNTRSSKQDTQFSNTESLSFKQSFNPSVVKNVVNNVNACAPTHNLKDILRDIYSPQSVEDKRAFEELSKIAFGRLKQYMRSHNVPYLQLEQIIIKAMHDLVNKRNVRNQFAMYSSMIKRQIEQLFEQPIRPQTSVYKPVNNRRVENVPDWFNKRNEPVMPSTDAIDFEAERQKVLAKLQGAI